MTQKVTFTIKNIQTFLKTPVFGKSYQKLRRNNFTSSYSILKIKLALSSSKQKSLSKSLCKHLPFAHTKSKKVQHACIVSQGANSVDLPKKCIVEKGRLLFLLIGRALEEKRAGEPTWKVGEKRDLKRVTSLELWNFVENHKNVENHTASNFKNYDQRSFRLLSKEFLQPVDPTHICLAKCLSNYGSLNSSQHCAFFGEIGLTEQNAANWITKALKDRCFLNIHSFENFGPNNFRISYQVPLVPLCKGKFNLSLLSVKIVIEFSLKKNSKTKKNPYGEYHKEGKVITIYLQNKPFRTDDIECLENIAPDTIYWGGSKTAINSFIASLNLTRGLPAVPFSQYFPIFKTARDRNQKKKSKANLVEDQYLQLNQSKIRKSNSNQIDIDNLSRDPSYQDQAGLDFKKLRIKILSALQNFYQQI